MKKTPLVKSVLLITAYGLFASVAQAESCCDRLSSSAEVIEPVAAESVSGELPRLLDLGANKCIPCKMMEPILEELSEEYAGQLEVEFIDVWQDRSAGDKYEVAAIPTQIFFSAEGEELFRHTGFIAKADILAKWKELGIELTLSDKEEE